MASPGPGIDRREAGRDAQHQCARAPDHPGHCLARGGAATPARARTLDRQRPSRAPEGPGRGQADDPGEHRRRAAERKVEAEDTPWDGLEPSRRRSGGDDAARDARRPSDGFHARARERGAGDLPVARAEPLGAPPGQGGGPAVVPGRSDPAPEAHPAVVAAPGAPGPADTAARVGTRVGTKVGARVGTEVRTGAGPGRGGGSSVRRPTGRVNASR
jgi:hypothetical protein